MTSLSTVSDMLPVVKSKLLKLAIYSTFVFGFRSYFLIYKYV